MRMTDCKDLFSFMLCAVPRAVSKCHPVHEIIHVCAAHTLTQSG